MLGRCWLGRLSRDGVGVLDLGSGDLTEMSETELVVSGVFHFWIKTSMLIDVWDTGV